MVCRPQPESGFWPRLWLPCGWIGAGTVPGGGARTRPLCRLWPEDGVRGSWSGPGESLASRSRHGGLGEAGVGVCPVARRAPGFLPWASPSGGLEQSAAAVWGQSELGGIFVSTWEVDFGSDFPEREVLAVSGRRWSVGAQVA